MSIQTTETIQRLWETFLREQLATMSPAQRQPFEQQFEDRFSDLLTKAAGNGGDGFLDLVGFGPNGPLDFEKLSYPHVTPDFDESALREALKRELSAYKIPRRFAALPAAQIPVLSSGKIDIPRLTKVFDA